MNDDDAMATITITLHRDGVVRTNYSGKNEVNASVSTLLYMGMLTACLQSMQKWHEASLETQERA